MTVFMNHEIKDYLGVTRAHGQPGALVSQWTIDLPSRSALYDSATGRGFPGRLYLNGEEVDPTGRAFAHVVSSAAKGTTYELPYLGKAAWENIVAKQASGNPVQRAGLQGGKL